MGLVAIYYFYTSTSRDNPITPEEKKEPVREIKIPVVEKNASSYLHITGQRVHQKDWGTLTLLDYKPLNQTFKNSSMNMIVKDIKLIELSDMNERTKELLREYTGLSFQEVNEAFADENLSMQELDEKVAFSKIDIHDKITYFQVSYSVQNTADLDLQFFSMENVSFNKDLTFNVPNKNFIMSDDTMMGTKSVSRIDYRPNETRKGMIGLINDSEEMINQLTSFSFTTSDILHGDSHKLLSKRKTFTVSLK